MNITEKSGPFLRGSDEWIAREHARALAGAVCINLYEIPHGQAHDEPKAHLQHVDVPASTVQKVREELAARKLPQ